MDVGRDANIDGINLIGQLLIILKEGNIIVAGETLGSLLFMVTNTNEGNRFLLLAVNL